MLKKLLLISLTVVALLLAGPLCLPSELHIEQRIQIRQSIERVYAFLADLNNLPSWDPLANGEKGGDFVVEGSGVGSFYLWSSPETGHGRIVISDLQDKSSLSYEIDFYEPRESKGAGSIQLQRISPEETDVLWKYEQKVDFYARYLSLVPQGMISSYFELGLKNLKRKLEG